MKRLIASPAEIDREARRVLPHLRRAGRVLVVGDDKARVIDRKSQRRRFLLSLDARLARAFLDAELIAPESGLAQAGEAAFVLSAIGEAFVVRRSSDRDPFGAQHRLLVRPKSGRESAAIPEYNAGESPLGWLKTRKGADGAPFLCEAEFLAGERLREDFTLALMSPKWSSSWPLERVDNSRRADYSPVRDAERAVAARRRFWAALDRIEADIASVLIGVCCHIEGLEAVEARLRLPKRSAKILLKLGLAALARHYGFTPPMEPRSIIRAKSYGALPQE